MRSRGAMPLLVPSLESFTPSDTDHPPIECSLSKGFLSLTTRHFPMSVGYRIGLISRLGIGCYEGLAVLD